MKILLVDDNASARRNLEGILSDRGHHVLLAANGLEALERLSSGGVDVIVSDIMLPIMDGFQFCHEVRRWKQLDLVPFVFFTGVYTSDEDEKFALSLGADMFIRKPMEPALLVKQIEAAGGIVDGELPSQSDAVLREEPEFQREYNAHLFDNLRRKIDELALANRHLTTACEENQLLAHAVSAIQEGVFIAGMDGALRYVNSAALELAGIDEAVLGRNVREAFFSPSVPSKLPEGIFCGAEAAGWEGEVLFRHASGREYPVHLVVSALKEKGRPSAVIGSFRDVSSQKEMYLKLIQAEKYHALGRLIAGVAHELNNPLTSVLGFSEILKSHEMTEECREHMSKINMQAQRMQQILRNLMTFSRQHPYEMGFVDINEVITNTLDLIGYDLLVRNMKVQRDLGCDLPRTMADDYQLRQVFLNLFLNASQAMEQADVSRRVLAIATRFDREANALQVLIRDGGPGIPAELINRIFDPFFTTRPTGEGTGLGLSVAYSILKEHGGDLTAWNEPAGGAAFCVSLPVVEYKGGCQKGEAEDSPLGAGGKKILVVDDEESIRRFLHFLLQKEWGNHVDTAKSGEEGLQRAQEKVYDLIICDIKMPTMDGITFYRSLLAEGNPAASCILFITGDIMGSDAAMVSKESGAPLLLKPFTIQELKSAIGRITANKNP